MICSQFKSLNDFVQSLREGFEDYEKKNVDLCKCEIAQKEQVR